MAPRKQKLLFRVERIAVEVHSDKDFWIIKVPKHKISPIIKGQKPKGKRRRKGREIRGKIR